MYCSVSKVWVKIIDCSLMPNQICSAGNCIDFDLNLVLQTDIVDNAGEKPNAIIPTDGPSKMDVKGIIYLAGSVDRGLELAEKFGIVEEDKLNKIIEGIKSKLAKRTAEVTETVAETGGAAKFTSWGFAKGGMARAILGNAAVAAGLYVGISYLGKIVADGDTNIQRGFNNAATWASTSYFVGATAHKIATKVITDQIVKKIGEEAAKKALEQGITQAAATAGLQLGPLAPLLAWPGFGWALAGLGVLISVFTFKNERYQQIDYQCSAWQAETGGESCELCNDQGLIPCTEYQCRSLGQSCELINQGTKDEKCVWINRNDIAYPIIEAWSGALLSGAYRYTPAGAVSPPDRGVNLQYTKSTDGCVPAFTPLSFGVTLDEPARCKLSPLRTNSFDTMGNLFLSGGIADYNHSYALSMPGSNSLSSENISIENNGNYELYVRCEDANGNSNPSNFVFKYCVDPEPDHTNPLVVFADPLNGMPIAHNTETLDATFYINEPAECKWSHLNQDYDNMENPMTCKTSVIEMNAYMLYSCTTTLTGLQNNIENNFYVRCKDQPSSTELRNTNTESYEYMLIGTEPLILNWVTPNNTLVKGPTTSVKVTIEAETSAGYDDGISTCYYSETGDEGSYIGFIDTNSFKHSQDLWVSQGSYKFYIRCIDLGGNPSEAIINFDVETDTSAPIIARVYYEDGYLKIVTDEKSECVYDNVACNYNFDEGISMVSIDDLEHYTSWNSNVNFYIKCKDTNGLYPSQDQCSLIVRPFDIYSG